MDYAFKESDWKLFRAKLPVWQENYMARLCKEYIALLSMDKPASDRFWDLEKRIHADKRATGVVCSISRSSMTMIIFDLYRTKAITLADLDEFSEELREWAKGINSDYCSGKG